MMTQEDRDILIRIDTRQKGMSERLDKYSEIVDEVKEDVAIAKGAWKATSIIGGGLFAVIGIIIAVLELS